MMQLADSKALLLRGRSEHTGTAEGLGELIFFLYQCIKMGLLQCTGSDVYVLSLPFAGWKVYD